MDFKGTILFDASPALLAAINRIADVLSVNNPIRSFAKPVFTQDGALIGHVEQRAETQAGSAPAHAVVTPEPGQVLAEKVEVDAMVSAEEVPAETDDSSKAKYTLVQVRKVMADVQERMSSDDEKRAVTKKMRDILLSLGATSIGKLSEEKYGEFIQQISAL